MFLHFRSFQKAKVDGFVLDFDEKLEVVPVVAGKESSNLRFGHHHKHIFKVKFPLDDILENNYLLGIFC